MSEGLDTADLIGIVLLAVLALLMLAIILKPTMRAGARVPPELFFTLIRLSRTA